MRFQMPNKIMIEAPSINPFRGHYPKKGKAGRGEVFKLASAGIRHSSNFQCREFQKKKEGEPNANV